MNIGKTVLDHLQLQLEMDLGGIFTKCAEDGMGDYSIVCFSLAKQLRRSPVDIARQIADKVQVGGLIQSVRAVGGYVNITLSPMSLAGRLLDSDAEQMFDIEKTLEGKVCFIDFCSVNLAKYMHIGHLAGTSIGSSVAKMLEAAGAKVVRINYIGDSGTSFGKVIAAYEMWGEEQCVASRGVDYLQELYVRYNRAEESDPTLTEVAKKVFVELESGNQQYHKLHKWFTEVSITECKRLLEIMDVEFDDWTGESHYMGEGLQPAMRLLGRSGIVTASEGASIVDLSSSGLGVALVCKSDGGSTYLSRDVGAIMDRAAKYSFDKGYYVTAIQQNAHFAQLFKIVDMLGLPYANELKHINYGMFSLPSGKIGSRFGKQAILSDIFDAAIGNARQLLIDRQYSSELVESISRSVGVSAVMFSVLKTERGRDCVFDLDKAINFDGETAPYIQYTYARANSVIKRTHGLPAMDGGYESVSDADSATLIALICDYEGVLGLAVQQCEPSVMSRYALSVCKAYNSYYAKCRVIIDDVVDAARCRLTMATLALLSRVMPLVNINIVEIM